MDKLESIIQAISSEDETERRYAAEDIGDMGDPAGIPYLIRLLRDPAIGVREVASDSLVLIGGEDVASALVPILDDDDASVRNIAVETLEKLRKDAINACISLYDSESCDLRKIAVDTLGKIEETRGSRGFEILVKALDDDNINVAIAACEALGRLGGKESITALVNKTGKHPSMDSAIILSLANLGDDMAKEALCSIAATLHSESHRDMLEMVKELMG